MSDMGTTFRQRRDVILCQRNSLFPAIDTSIPIMCFHLSPLRPCKRIFLGAQPGGAQGTTPRTRLFRVVFCPGTRVLPHLPWIFRPPSGVLFTHLGAIGFSIGTYPCFNALGVDLIELAPFLPYLFFILLCFLPFLLPDFLSVSHCPGPLCLFDFRSVALCIPTLIRTALLTVRASIGATFLTIPLVILAVALFSMFDSFRRDCSHGASPFLLKVPVEGVWQPAQELGFGSRFPSHTESIA